MKSQKKWKSFGMTGYKWIKSDYFEGKKVLKIAKILQKRTLSIGKQQKRCENNHCKRVWITMWKLWFSPYFIQKNRCG